MHKWLSVVGIGENGLPGLSPVARSLVEQAEVLVGGDRHLAMLPTDDPREKWVWSSPIAHTIDEIIRRQGQSICVLASGDPMCYGIGATLTRKIPIAQMTIIPAPSALALACARLGWSFIEQHPTRLQYIADNAAALGTPNLNIIAGVAPAALQDLPQPDAIFIGGGLTTPDLFETCWNTLRPGGRLVANAVTIEGEQQLFQWHSQFQGDLTRIAIQRAEPVGKFLGWKAMVSVTQWTVVKGISLSLSVSY